jgi:DNA replication and repair protein RecF
MALVSLAVRGFRNLRPVAVEFVPGGNYLFGPNGAGKTNLLEAIHYLAIGRSFRNCADNDMVGFGAELLVVSGSDSAGRRGEIRFDRSEKRAALDGTRVERLSDYLGWLSVVAVLLDDIELVRGSPALRRGFLDMAIAKSDRGYIPVLAAYRRVLAQRNQLLARRSFGGHEESGADGQLGVWDDELVRAGVAVYECRRAVVGKVLDDAAGFSGRLAGEPVRFAYAPSVDIAGGDPKGVFTARLAATRARSLVLGQTLVGPHRDDIRIRCGERDLRRFGSVGEQRLAGIALRLAEAELLAGRGGSPTFLLDEVASELDERRSRLLFELVEERGQVIYVAARRLAHGAGRAGTKEFHVETGEVHEVPPAE